MRRIRLMTPVFVLAAVLFCGCGNPLKRPAANVFPGSAEYETRVADLKISPEEAYEIAYAQAKKEGKLQFLSRRPTVLAKRTYVFSMPQPSGASLHGYHVDGRRGTVRFVTDKTVVSPR